MTNDPAVHPTKEVKSVEINYIIDYQSTYLYDAAIFRVRQLYVYDNIMRLHHRCAIHTLQLVAVQKNGSKKKSPPTTFYSCVKQ